MESLESVQLADWLGRRLKQRKIELKEAERQSLIDEEINGSAFLLLSEDDLKDLGFKMGARRVILEIINSTQQAGGNHNGVENSHNTANTLSMMEGYSKSPRRIITDGDDQHVQHSHDPIVVVPQPKVVHNTGRRIEVDGDEPIVEVQNPNIVDNKLCSTRAERTVPRPSSPPLEMRHSFEVSQSLKNLTDDDIIKLGKALGLNGVKLSRKRNLPSDMVDCWLRQEDDVITISGDPTRSSLADALEKIDQNGTANKVRQLQVHRKGTRSNGYPVFNQTPSLPPSKPGLADKPTIAQLHQFPGTKLKVISSVAPKWKVFGLLLDFDEQGLTLEMIEANWNRSHFDCCTEMFKRWLKGEGIQPATWRQVISLLEDNGQLTLAIDLKSVLKG